MFFIPLLKLLSLSMGYKGDDDEDYNVDDDNDDVTLDLSQKAEKR